MKEINTSLLREKFVLHDPNIDMSDVKPVIALSNRMEVVLQDKTGGAVETFIVRTQNMHSCVRMAARIVSSFRKEGPLLKRSAPFDWEDAWSPIANDYEQAYNPDLWGCVYHQGKTLFAVGERHPLLDVIEKCDATNKNAYEDAIPIAEDAFKKTGKIIKIEYDGNVALVVNVTETEGRCGIILRGADKTTTFNYTVSTKPVLPINLAQCMAVGAAYLEGVQLAFMVGLGNAKIHYNIIKQGTPEKKKHNDAITRLRHLSGEINTFEKTYHVRYRPEHPSFQHMIAEAEENAMKSLKPAKGSGFI